MSDQKPSVLSLEYWVEAPGPLWRLYSLVAVLIVPVSVVIWGSVVAALAILRFPRHVQSWALRGWNLFVCRLFRMKIKIEGASHHNPDEASLVVSNHQSLFDIPAAYWALDGDLRMVAKKSLFYIPVFGYCLRITGFISVERGNQRSGRKASTQISEKIRSGLHVWVAPEGTRSDGTAMKEFKKGSFAVAIEAGVPIQPIVIMDSWKALSRKNWLPRPGSTIHVKVLPRISVEGYTVEDRAKLARVVYKEMQEALSGPELSVESGQA